MNTRFLSHFLYLTAFCALFIAFSIFFFDRPIAYYFQHISEPLACTAKAATTLADPTYNVFLWPVFFFFARFLFKKEVLGNRLLLIAISVACVNTAAVFVKMLFGRDRPELLFSENLYGFAFFSAHNPEFSFPSGHACTIGTVIGSLACFFPRYSFPLFIIAFLIAFSRVVLTFHYLSDIIAGLWLGIMGAQALYLIMKKEKTRFT